MNESRKINRWLWKVAIAFMGFTLLPYIVGAALAGGRFYTGFHYNTDDFCHYASWMTQAAEGRFFLDNRFTTDPQPGRTIHLFFWWLGSIQGLTGLPTMVVMHGARFLFGVLFILAFFRLGKRLLVADGAAAWSVVIALFSSGLGWLMWPPGGFGINAPADAWQPELITFTTLYFNPLFAVSAWLMIEVLNAALDLKEGWRPALRGALAMLVLANIHTYDIVTLTAAGAGFVFAKALMGKADWRWFGRVFVMGLGAVPALLWFVYVLRIDPVFQSRAATLTFSEPLWKYILGFGFLLPLALGGAISIFKRKETFTEDGKALLPAWGVIGMMIPYLPGVLFQRKLWMGAHWPLCFLTAGFVWEQAQKLAPNRQRLALGAAVLLLIPTNLLWMARDFDFLSTNRSNTTLHWPYLDQPTWDLISWLKENTEDSDAVAAMPNIACYIAAYAGNYVYVGHWSETPNFADRLQEVNFTLLSPLASLEEKRAVLQKSRARYVVNLKEPLLVEGRPTFGADLSPLADPVYENQVYRIYRVR